MRRKFWMLSGRYAVCKFAFPCIVCVGTYAIKRTVPIATMGNFPSSRIQLTIGHSNTVTWTTVVRLMSTKSADEIRERTRCIWLSLCNACQSRNLRGRVGRAYTYVILDHTPLYCRSPRVLCVLYHSSSYSNRTTTYLRLLGAAIQLTYYYFSVSHYWSVRIFTRLR